MLAKLAVCDSTALVRGSAIVDLGRRRAGRQILYLATATKGTFNLDFR